MQCIGWKIKSCESTIPPYLLHIFSCNTYKYKVWEESGNGCHGYMSLPFSCTPQHSVGHWKLSQWLQRKIKTSHNLTTSQLHHPISYPLTFILCELSQDLPHYLPHATLQRFQVILRFIKLLRKLSQFLTHCVRMWVEGWRGGGMEGRGRTYTWGWGCVLVSQARPNQPKWESLSILQMGKEGSGYTGDAQ